MTEEKYRIFDHMIEGVQILNFDLIYIYVNDTVETQGKYSKEELLGHSMIEKYPGIETTEMFRSIQQCMKEHITHQMVNEFDFPDGSKGYFELRMQPVPEGVLILSFDITQQKQAEQFLVDTNRVLEEKVQQRTQALTAKNKEMEQFSYIASHDLQEPIRTVTNYIGVLKEDYGELLDGNAMKYLNAMNKAAERMSTLVIALLDYSRLGRNRELCLAECSDLVVHVLADLEHMIRSSGVVIHVGSMPALNVYEAEMRQLFQNLVTNAIKFRRTEVTSQIDISCEDLGTYWKFFVKDNGIGIAPQYYERIFQIFHKLHSSDEYEGSGIGLANCKKIVELHGGEIFVESTLNEGSTFSFTILKM
jgi:PAS domain S-box-containing protein